MLGARFATIKKLAKALGVKPEELVEEQIEDETRWKLEGFRFDPLPSQQRRIRGEEDSEEH